MSFSNKYRTHRNHELAQKNESEKVVLSGWVHRRRDHGGLIFIDLRDRWGLTQIVSDPADNPEAHAIFEKVRSEWVITVTGTVRLRPDGQENNKMPTGDIEILATEINIISESETPPFEIDQDKHVGDETRLKYRYLDLRRERQRNNLIYRHMMTKFTRDYFDSEGFLDIETPTLIKGTPEGAREFLVPSRVHPGKFFVLPQSPQQLKQMLMVAGVDRYFQMARCYRDEDMRGDRQPEFTQVDLEMSFVTQEDVLILAEDWLLKLTAEFAPQKKLLADQFPRMTWDNAMNNYGIDKPDIRFEMKLHDVSDAVAGCEFQVFSKTVEGGGTVRAFFAPGGNQFSRKDIDELTKLAQDHGARGLAWIKYVDGKYDGVPAGKMSEDELKKVSEICEANSDGIFFFGAGDFLGALEPLGQVRLAVAKRLEMIPEDMFAYLWVTDFPMFEYSKETGELSAMHHPFTRPHDDDIALLDTEPEKARSIGYDIVLNGVEIGGGSVRIHERDLQKKIFGILKIGDQEAEEKFGHMMKSFEYGVPPHAGIAIGWDRLLALFRDEESLREIITFPKTGSVEDLMIGAPSEMPDAQVEESGVRVINT